MTDHGDTGPELQQLAKAILGVVDPLIQAGAAAMASAAEGGEQGKCAQVWCPFCAVAAVAAGESHPLTSIVAQYGTVLLAQLRAAARDEPVRPPTGATVAEADPQSNPPGRYQPIPVTVHDD